MIPNNEKFGSIEPISGSINEIIDKSQDVEIDYIYGENSAIHEIMTEYSCTKEQAEQLFEEAKMQMIENCLNELIKEGKVIQNGVNTNGEPLYYNVEPVKKSKKK